MKSEITAGLLKDKRPLFIPDFTAQDVLDIDFKALKDLGVRHILIDLDLTLRKKMTRKLDAEVIIYLLEAVKKYGFSSLNIASNNMLNLRSYSTPLNANVFQPYWHRLRLVRKPNKRFYNRIIDKLAAKPAECVMIGDKLHADVFGGNRAGMVTILVNPNGSDYWYDRLLFTRIRERRTIGGWKIPPTA